MQQGAEGHGLDGLLDIRVFEDDGGVEAAELERPAGSFAEDAAVLSDPVKLMQRTAGLVKNTSAMEVRISRTRVGGNDARRCPRILTASQLRGAGTGAPGGTRTPNPFLRTELLFH